jgi:hypothetical protein
MARRSTAPVHGKICIAQRRFLAHNAARQDEKFPEPGYMRRLLLASCLSLASSGAFAQTVCVVADPTGTPLNVRASPNGSILGALYNGTRVSLLSVAADRSGQSWAYIAPLGPGKRGYVFYNYLAC